MLTAILFKAVLQRIPLGAGSSPAAMAKTEANGSDRPFLQDPPTDSSVFQHPSDQ